MALVVYCSSDEQWSFAEQTTWGTAVGDAAASIGILTEGFGLDSQINFRNPPRARAQRYQHYSDVRADQKGVVYQTNGMAVPAAHELLDMFLYGVMQNVVESTLEAGVHRKTFTFGATQPDFTAHAGEFFTLWGDSGVASNDQKMYDAIISELTLTCAPGANEGILWVAPTFIARSHSDTANYTGTATFATTGAAEEYNFYDIITATLSSAVVLGDNGISITIRNGARKVGQATGVPQTFALPRYEVELSIHCLWDSAIRTLMASAKADTAVTFEFEWGTAGAVGHLEFTGTGEISQAVNIEHGLEGNFCTVNILCSGLYGTTEPFQVILTSNNDRVW